MCPKKLFLPFVLVLIGSVAHSQNTVVKGILKDMASSEIISSATISTKNSNIGTISNEEGAFELTIPKSNDTITISHLGYRTLKLPVASVKPDETAFYMEPMAEALEEVIVSKENFRDLIEILIKASKARFAQPIVMNSYFREFVKVNEEYKKFSDGELAYLITRKGKDIKSELNVKQARAIFLPDEKTEDDEEMDFNNMSKIFSIPSRIENFDFVETLLLKKSKFDNYDFTLKSKTSKEGEQMLTLYFQPKDEVEESIYKGSITYNPKTKLISNINLKQDPDFKKYIREINLLIIKVTLLDQSIDLNFKEVNGNYLLASYISNVKFKMQNKSRYHHVLEFKTDMIVTNFTPNTSSFDKKNVYKERSLYKFGNKHSYPFWKNNNAIVLTAEQEAIIKRLENNQ